MRLLGIDPGLQRTGWGVIEIDGNRLRALAAGVLRSTATRSLAERLAELHDGLSAVIATWTPDAAAVEETFVNKNPGSTLKLGQARGIALLVPALAGLPVHEYATNSVKSAVVGVGHATKEQVAAMVQRLLPGLASPTAADATDALAVAICHAHHAQTHRVWRPSPPRGEGQGEGVVQRGKRRPRKPLLDETKFGRQLRENPTELEKLLWLKLRNRQFDGWKFRRQVPIVGYVADFACLEAGLIIELDGIQHAQRVERDERRTAILNQAGFRVLRFWNGQLVEDFPSVVAAIKDALGAPSPRPSPRGGEGRT